VSVSGLGKTVYGLAACDVYNCLYVSDYCMGRLHRVDLSASNKVTTWSTDTTPAAIHVTSAHHVLVACCRPKKLQEFTTTGSIVREICLQFEPWHAVPLKNDSMCTEFAVCANDSPEIHVVDASGQITKSFGSQTDASDSSYERKYTSCFPHPRMMAVADDDTILVTDIISRRLVSIDATFTAGNNIVPCRKAYCFQKSIIQLT